MPQEIWIVIAILTCASALFAAVFTLFGVIVGALVVLSITSNAKPVSSERQNYGQQQVNSPVPFPLANGLDAPFVPNPMELDPKIVEAERARQQAFLDAALNPGKIIVPGAPATLGNITKENLP